MLALSMWWLVWPVTIVFALFFSYLAVDIWAQERSASDSASREVTALTRLRVLTAPEVLNAPGALQLLEAYRNAVSSEEWGVNFNHQASQAAAWALRDLRFEGARLNRDGAAAPLVNQWFKAVDDLEEARQKRLVIGSDHTDNNQWLVVILLAFFSYLTIAAVHMDRPPAGRLVLVLFSIATTLALWQLAMHTNPYNGGVTRVAMPAYLATPSANRF